MSTPTSADRPAALRGHYDVILALFCSMLLISNIGATKLIEFGPIVTDGGAFLFPLTYIFGDVLAEIYGLTRTRQAILLGFAISILASLVFLAVDASPPAAEWPNQDAWHAVLGFVPRIVVASLAGYLAGQFLNAYVLVAMKRRAQATGGSLIARLLGSTVVGELADTSLFCTIAFVGVVGWGTLTNYIVVGYLYKVLVEVLMLPVTVRVIAWLKRREPGYRPA